MDLLVRTKEICRIYNIKPARDRGQNFLITEEIYNKIIKVSDLTKEDTVLEVGPGLGFLTAKLARRVKRVMAVEVDTKLAGVLKTSLLAKRIKNVKVVNKDILQIHFSQFTSHNSLFKIVANLPYNITSIFLRKFLSAEVKPNLMVLMLQKEVAERICARTGEMSLLAVSVQFYSQPRIVEYVNRDNFWPEPEVDSAIVKIKVKKVKPEVKEKKFFQMVKFGFSARRKMLKNNLAAGYRVKPSETEEWLKLANLDLNVRAQDLSLNNWLKLFGVLEENML